MTTVSKTNINEIPEIIDTFVEHGAYLFSFARYGPTIIEKSSQMTPEEYHNLLETCWERFKNMKNQIPSLTLKIIYGHYSCTKKTSLQYPLI